MTLRDAYVAAWREIELCPSLGREHLNPVLEYVREMEGEVERLREYHRRNIDQCRRFDRERAGHHCGWRVTLEAIEERSKVALTDAAALEEE